MRPQSARTRCALSSSSIQRGSFSPRATSSRQPVMMRTILVRNPLPTTCILSKCPLRERRALQMVRTASSGRSTARQKAALHSADGKTSKFLLEFADGTAVESVLMRQPYGNSICISTQAGCAMGCLFCSTGKQGFNRNLTTAEIVGQLWWAERELRRAEGFAAGAERDRYRGKRERMRALASHD